MSVEIRYPSTSVATPVGVSDGGTGIASYTIGDLLYASGATTLSKLADVATGKALVSGGIGVAPSYGTALVAGVYTPTRSAEANTTGNVTTFESQYLRVGNTVTVSGRFTATPTLTATATSFELDLPLASNIGAVEDLSGTAFCGSIAGMGASIEGSVANNTAVFKWVSTDITAKSWSYSFVYAVI